MEKPIDEIIVGKGEGDDISKYEVKEEKNLEITEENYIKIISSKNIKKIISGLDFLIKNPNLTENVLEIIIQLMEKKNPAVQMKSIEVFKTFVEGDKEIKFSTKKAAKNILKNVLTSNKKSVKEMAITSLEKISKHFDKETTQDLIISLLKEKSPKLVVSGLNFIEILTTSYGASKFEIEIISKEVVNKISTGKRLVKTEAMNLMKVMCNFFGKTISPFIKELPKYPLEEIEKYIDERAGKVEVPKFVDEDDYDPEADTREVELFNKYKDKWCSGVIKTTKRLEKLKKLRELVNESDVPKILPGDYKPIISMLKKVTMESNVQLQVECLKILRNLSKGLKGKFRRGSRAFLNFVVHKLRDPKAQIVRAAQECIHNFFSSLNYYEMIEEFNLQIKDKNPKMKVNLIQIFEEFSIPDEYTAENLMQEENGLAVNQFIQELKKCTKDGDAMVRKKSSALLSKLKEKFAGHDEFFEEVSQSK